MKKKILVVKTGSTDPAAAEKFGDYDERFVRILAEHGIDSSVASVCTGELLPQNPSQFAGIILTGSRANVYDCEPWMERTAQWTLDAAEQQVPVLAVCFGHQLLAHFGGGTVEPNAKGVEFGSHAIELTEAGLQDPLFSGIEQQSTVQQYHYDVITQLPEGAIQLATNDHTEYQAYALGDYIRGIQWHPEITDAFVQALWESIELEGPIQKSEHGTRIIENWLAHYVTF